MHVSTSQGRYSDNSQAEIFRFFLGSFPHLFAAVKRTGQSCPLDLNLRNGTRGELDLKKLEFFTNHTDYLVHVACLGALTSGHYQLKLHKG